jgi:hypothetical protein
MKANPSAPEGLALEGASAVLRGLPVELTTACAARLASAPLQSQRGSRGILRQAPWPTGEYSSGTHGAFATISSLAYEILI